MFTAPASAEPGWSGVGENTTSTRARLLIESMSSETERAVPPPGFAEATLKPSIVTGTKSGGTPLIETLRAKPPMLSIETPGRNLMNSPTFPSGTKPSSSVATTDRRFGACRCSLMAIAAPLISREVAMTNSSSFTTARSPPAATRASEMSRRATSPAATGTSSVAVRNPECATRRRAVPAGTPVNRKRPSASVNASSPMPSTLTRACARYSPPAGLNTLPSMAPVAGAAAAA